MKVLQQLLVDNHKIRWTAQGLYAGLCGTVLYFIIKTDFAVNRKQWISKYLKTYSFFLAVFHFAPRLVTYHNHIHLHAYSLTHATYFHSALLQVNGASRSISIRKSCLFQWLYQGLLNSNTHGWIRYAPVRVTMLVQRGAALNYYVTSVSVLH